MTLQEYEAQGGCEGCYFYGTIDVDGRKGCTFYMTRRGNVEKIILDFAKAVCEGERTMIDEKKVELMKKLQRLAERGVGGEKEGAQKKSG